MAIDETLIGVGGPHLHGVSASYGATLLPSMPAPLTFSVPNQPSPVASPAKAQLQAVAAVLRGVVDLIDATLAMIEEPSNG